MKAPVQIHQLDQRVGHERLIETPDGAGGILQSWENIGALWAQIIPLSAAEKRTAERDISIIRYELRVRDGADLAIGDRLLWAGRTLGIRAVRPLGKSRRFLVLDCEEEA